MNRGAWTRSLVTLLLRLRYVIDRHTNPILRQLLQRLEIIVNRFLGELNFEDGVRFVLRLGVKLIVRLHEVHFVVVDGVLDDRVEDPLRYSRRCNIRSCLVLLLWGFGLAAAYVSDGSVASQNFGLMLQDHLELFQHVLVAIIAIAV